VSNLQVLDIAGSGGTPNITDVGVHLTKAKLPKLRTLHLYESKVSDEAIRRLQAEFPGLAVYR
jgi:hypothetical protein